MPWCECVLTATCCALVVCSVLDILSRLDEIRTDIPRIDEYMGRFLGHAHRTRMVNLRIIRHEFETETLADLKGTPGSQRLLIYALKALHAASEEDYFQALTSHGIDPQVWMPKNVSFPDALSDAGLPAGKF